MTTTKNMSVLAHLAEFRRRFFISSGAVVVCAVGVTIFHNDIVKFIIEPFEDATGNSKLQAIDPLGGLAFRLRIAFFLGIGIASPIVMFEIWRFVSPALQKRERKYAIPFLASAVVLFFVGGLFAYLTLPRALEFLADVGGTSIAQNWTATSYANLLLLMVVAFGISFEFPVLVVGLLLARVVTTKALRAYRRQAIVGIAAIAAVITPSQDPYSLLLMAVPMVVFYEIAIIIGRIAKR